MNSKSCIALCLVVVAAALGAQQPGSIKEIPVYPGAARYEPARTAQDGEQRRLAQEVSRESVEYRTTVSAEEVYAWYRQKLDAKRMDAPVVLDKQGRMPIRGFSTPYEGEDFKDSSRIMSDDNYEGAWIRDQLKARRKALDGAYVKVGTFTWSFIDKQGRPHALSVGIEDRSFSVYRGDEALPDGSFAVGKKNYRQSTSIRLTETVTMAAGDADSEDAEPEDAESDD